MPVLDIERETFYGPVARKAHKQYSVYLQGSRIASATTKEQAEQEASKALCDAWEFVGATSAVRTAHDGTVLVIREVGKGIAQVEYNRNGRSGSISVGKMTGYRDGNYTEYRDVQEYADYCVEQYNH